MCLYHNPVMLREGVSALAIKPNGAYVDATLGGGGHARAILAQLTEGRLYAFDCDAQAAANVDRDSRFVFVHSNFKYLQTQLRYLGCEAADGIFADLGVSSHQFDTAGRGFSFRFDADLDMRMNTEATLTAQEVINRYPEEELARIFRQYGEVAQSARVAALIAKARKLKPIRTTVDLQRTLTPLIPRQYAHKFLSTIYQSIRIEVNKEMEALAAFLEQSLRLLHSGGRLAVISYHSLEDRMVKNFMRTGNVEGTISKDFYGNNLTPFLAVTPKAITPSKEEITLNNRARSAKLRAVEKR